MTRDDLDLSLATVKQIGEDTGIGMVLVDTTEQETMPSIMDIFSFAKSYQRLLGLQLLSLKNNQQKIIIIFLKLSQLPEGAT